MVGFSSLQKCTVATRLLAYGVPGDTPDDYPELESEEPYFRQGPLSEPDHQVPASWVAFLTMREEIRDPIVHDQL
jgi:hypothetical protein